MSGQHTFYAATYGNFTTPLLAEIRAAAYGEDIGQNSWLTADELRAFLGWLGLSARSAVLDIGSGSGGPALFTARTLGCDVTGVELNPDGAAAGNAEAQRRGLSSRARFLTADASRTLPLDDGAFTAVMCVDAISHLRGRLQVLRDWYRLLAPGGRILYTDPVVITGLVCDEEIALRSATGYTLFAPPGEDERLLAQAGFKLIRREDATANIAAVSGRWHAARDKHRDRLADIEGEAEFDNMQEGMSAVHRLSSERRLSRIVFVAEKP